jgi:hypothetical protein
MEVSYNLHDSTACIPVGRGFHVPTDSLNRTLGGPQSGSWRFGFEQRFFSLLGIELKICGHPAPA